MAGLYNKIIELDKRLQLLDGGSSVSIPSNLEQRLSNIELNNNEITTYSQKITDIEKKLVTLEIIYNETNLEIPPNLSDRILALESNKVPDNLFERFSLLENKQIPPDLSVRVSAIEAKLAEFNSLNLQEIKEKIISFDTTIANLKQAFVVLDDQVETLKNK